MKRARIRRNGVGAAAVLWCALSAQAQAQEPTASAAGPKSTKGWEFGAVVDLGHTTRPLALGQREQGLALGHSDAVARGPLGRHFSAQVGIAAHRHDGRTEAELEEAWVQTRSLPAGLQARAGRFGSQIGRLNEQHPHADDFVERPLLYRAFLGGHWFDDGLRLNWTAPTPFYLALGAEAFRGRRLVEEAAHDAGDLGATTLTAKLGADIGTEHSWQLGLSHLRNRREAAVEDEAGHAEAGHDHGHGHSHAHGAAFSGRRVDMADFTWKWAPGGNNRRQQLRVDVEWARVSGLNRHAHSSDRHEAGSLAAVWRFAPSWEAGARTDWLRVRVPHGDHFHAGRLREQAAMLAWKPSHLQSLRLQFTRQRDAQGIEAPARRSVQLQYILSFGAHGAHSY